MPVENQDNGRMPLMSFDCMIVFSCPGGFRQKLIRFRFQHPRKPNALSLHIHFLRESIKKLSKKNQELVQFDPLKSEFRAVVQNRSRISLLSRQETTPNYLCIILRQPYLVINLIQSTFLQTSASVSNHYSAKYICQAIPAF